uniref:(northern house mosquito) hypothetical protein n=1 Tax=Culex pipiens TaxID=7175 RepID=A0A8D8BEG6_CULPI
MKVCCCRVHVLLVKANDESIRTLIVVIVADTWLILAIRNHALGRNCYRNQAPRFVFFFLCGKFFWTCCTCCPYQNDSSAVQQRSCDQLLLSVDVQYQDHLAARSSPGS